MGKLGWEVRDPNLVCSRRIDFFYAPSTPQLGLASNHVNILRLAEGINPQYVAFVMNSRIGRLQTDQLSAGSAQQELYPKDISQFYIPFVSPDLQKALVQKITQAHNLEKESEALLTRAKQAVEMAIEQGEAAGLACLSAS